MVIKNTKNIDVTGPHINISKLINIMKNLRDKQTGCPWDQVQTFDSIAKYTIEEAYEVNEAIFNKDWKNLKEELGDLLLQVIYHSEIADELELFNFNDVVQTISKKMVDRHPHVFKNNSKRKTIEEQTIDWEKIKESEKETTSDKFIYLLDDVTRYLPALSRAEKIQKKAAMVDFDWKLPREVMSKLIEESQEFLVALEQNNKLAVEEEIGDILFTIVNMARKLDVDPESALRKTNQKFQKRLNGIEDDLGERGQKIDTQTMDELERLWQSQKNKQ